MASAPKTSVDGNLSAITAAIKALERETRTAQSTVRAFQQSLNLDGGNIDAVKGKFSAMREQLQKTNETIVKYNEKIKKLKELQGKLDTSTKEGKEQFDDYERQIKDTTTAISKAEAQVKSLESATTKLKEAQAASSAAATKLQDKLKTLNSVATKVSAAILAMVAAMAKLVTSAAEQGNELYSLALKYDTSAEAIQKYNRALQLATGESDLFTNSLQVMIKGMSQIASGRGVNYRKALKAIGLSYSDLASKTQEEQFYAIVEGLSAVTNETDRLAYAQTLLGDSGTYIAQVIASGTDALNEYLDAAENYGILTTDQVNKLNEMSLKIEELKSRWSAMIATIIVDHAEAIEKIFEFLEDKLIPAIGKVVDVIAWLTTDGLPLLIGLISTLTAIKLTTWIVGVVTKILSLVAAYNAGTISALAFKVAVGGVAAGLATAAVIAGVTAAAMNSVTEATNAATEAAQEFEDYSNDYNTASTTISTSSDSTLTVKVEVTASGDTQLSDDTASNIASLTVEQINKKLGGLI